MEWVVNPPSFRRYTPRKLRHSESRISNFTFAFQFFGVGTSESRVEHHLCLAPQAHTNRRGPLNLISPNFVGDSYYINSGHQINPAIFTELPQ